MRKEVTNKICIGIMIIWVVFIFSFPSAKESKHARVNLPELERLNLSDSWYDEILKRCNHTTIQRSVYCVRGFVSKFFKYQDDRCRNAYKLNKLLEEGGNCCSWTNFYNEVMRDLGYKTKPIRYYYKNKIIMQDSNRSINGHKFLLTWDDNGNYCIIDQLLVFCG